MCIVCSGGEKLEFVPASSQLLFAPTSVDVVVDSGQLAIACVSALSGFFAVVTLVYVLSHHLCMRDNCICIFSVCSLRFCFKHLLHVQLM